ncbi:hypothetical protein PVAP13_9KG588101 [Panicum virgatum]|uniref:Uncharacterized protein n=1 Tax=Panicum virgatum TaxID=38727 RepID=A0A8T0P3H2_PANVG|nr:hypothetical protein PVAP13_9KG588101 [Panicum virgatum]
MLPKRRPRRTMRCRRPRRRLRLRRGRRVWVGAPVRSEKTVRPSRETQPIRSAPTRTPPGPETAPLLPPSAAATSPREPKRHRPATPLPCCAPSVLHCPGCFLGEERAAPSGAPGDLSSSAPVSSPDILPAVPLPKVKPPIPSR